ncbi:MAG: hypothetical protein FWE82_04800 [Defluviitaleaceae bacterium]|nr:hypothetical protein [Defluviitaleaceae bacterium]
MKTTIENVFANDFGSDSTQRSDLQNGLILESLLKNTSEIDITNEKILMLFIYILKMKNVNANFLWNHLNSIAVADIEPFLSDITGRASSIRYSKLGK